MQLKLRELSDKNITIVFPQLDVDKVSIDRIKSVSAKFGAQAKILELGVDRMVAILLEIENIAEFANRRLKVSDQSSSRVEGTILPDLTSQLSKLVGSEIVAYGFNYDATFELPGITDTAKYFQDKFLTEEVRNLKVRGMRIEGFEPVVKLSAKNGPEFSVRLSAGRLKGPMQRSRAVKQTCILIAPNYPDLAYFGSSLSLSLTVFWRY